MKAILVIDMPSGCKSCMFGFNNQRCLVKAYMTDDKMNDSGYCPLKPMPKFKINEKRVEFLNMTEREKHFYELGHDDASDEFYEEIEK